MTLQERADSFCREAVVVEARWKALRRTINDPEWAITRFQLQQLREDYERQRVIKAETEER